MLLAEDFRELRAGQTDVDVSDLEPIPFSNIQQPVIHIHKITMRDLDVVLAIIGIKTSIVSGHSRRAVLRYASFP